jgi:hypothetical protein
MNNICFLYKIGNEFYCDNCGVLRGSPYNDPCDINCNAEWIIDKKIIAEREKIRELKCQEMEQNQMKKEDIHFPSLDSNCTKENYYEDHKKESYIPYIEQSGQTHLINKQNILCEEYDEEEKFYNGGIQNFLKKRMAILLKNIK